MSYTYIQYSKSSLNKDLDVGKISLLIYLSFLSITDKVNKPLLKTKRHFRNLLLMFKPTKLTMWNQWHYTKLYIK